MNELDVALGTDTDADGDPVSEDFEDTEWSLMVLENDFRTKGVRNENKTESKTERRR